MFGNPRVMRRRIYRLSMVKEGRLCLLEMGMGRAIFAGRFELLLMRLSRNLGDVATHRRDVLQVEDPNR